MNKVTVLNKVLLALIISSLAPVVMAQATGASLASTLEVYVFPADGQAPAQQSKDESACFEWAVSTTGTDPFKANKETAEQQQAAAATAQAASAATKGAGLKGALGGAAAGAVVGEIAHDDANEGAAVGAAVGAIAARRKAKAAAQSATHTAQATAASQQQSADKDIDGFKKAFSACLEGKKYTVR